MRAEALCPFKETSQRAFEQVRSEFVLRASHELRTLITSMHMAFSLLRECLHFPPETREHEFLHTLDRQMCRLVRLIDDLLDFSRYPSGQQTLELRPCDIGGLLGNALQHTPVGGWVHLQASWGEKGGDPCCRG
ncbi:hypothetical protein GCM10027514_31960 [Azotobacter armeniacus]